MVTGSLETAGNSPEVYEGQFGPFTLTAADRRGVLVYRGGVGVAAVCFAAGVAWVLLGGDLHVVSWLYSVFWLALGVSLATIHIYLAPLHRALQVFWAIGGLASLWVAHQFDTPFAQTVYDQPLTILGVGFTFAALTGIFFKEGFCFGRLETKVLTPLVPLLLLGHLAGVLPLAWEKGLLVAWAVCFAVFALRKAIQSIPPDIGDKSVFEYLKQRPARV
ncbi:MAG: DUF2301 domain-containing membrane protein [Cyanobacteria bacterium Co-bin13]|nr:DUF2301 domain-containing membrane protein [Cyanobacteria bacterium Co-bin13]